MKKQTFVKSLLITLLVATSATSFGQIFEGWITYKMEMGSPNTAMFPDSVWQQMLEEQLGERGYGLQKCYYKKDKYRTEIDAGKDQGIQIFNPKNHLLYSWELDGDTATTIDTRKYVDKFKEFLASDLTDTIMGIPCKSIILKSSMGKMTVWYNSDYLKIAPATYKNHEYGHWAKILEKTGCLPLKIEQNVFMIKMTQTAIEYKETPLNDKLFELPKFKKVLANPIN
jgi:hypothetical protein